MQDYDLENLIVGGRGTITQKCVERMREAGINDLYEIKEMILTDNYDKLDTVKGMRSTLKEKIILRVIDIDLPDRNKEVENKAEKVKITVSKPKPYIEKTPLVIKENIIKFQLPKIMEKYIIAMVVDSVIPKFLINSEHNYPINDMIFGKEEVYIKAEFLKNNFNRYISKNYNITDVTDMSHIDPFKYAIIGSKMIVAVQSAGKRYQLNRYLSITGNNENYIKILRETMNEIAGGYTNISQAFDPFIDPFYDPRLDIEDDEESVMVYSTSEKKNVIINNNASNKEEKIIINSCHPILGDRYLATFSILEKRGSRYDFDMNLLVGTYQFDRSNPDDGEILISGYKNSIPDLKSKIIKML